MVVPPTRLSMIRPPPVKSQGPADDTVRAMSRSWRRVGLVLFLAAALGGGLLGERLLAFTDEARSTLRTFTELVSLAHDRYGKQIEYRDVVESSIQGMLQALDPHTSFLSASAYSTMRDRQESTLFGARHPGGHAQRAADGHHADRGHAGLAPRSAGRRSHQLDRGRAHRDDGPGRRGAPAQGAQGHPGHHHRSCAPVATSRWSSTSPATRSRRPRFATPTCWSPVPATCTSPTSTAAPAARWRRRSPASREEGLERLILDLRGNGGGLLDQAIAVSDQFLARRRQGSSKRAAVPATRFRSTKRPTTSKSSTCR